MFKSYFKAALKTGALLSGTTTAALLVASFNENDGSWAAINNVTHIVDGDDVVYGDHFSARNSTIGTAINSAAMFAWAAIYELVFGRVEFPKSALTSSAFAAGAYVVDYHVVPKRFTPGIEHKISRKAIFWLYVIVAATLCFAPRSIGRRN